MTLEMLEERCQRFIDLMRQGSAAIDRQDAIVLEAVSRSSEILLDQIEQAWHLALSEPDAVSTGSWERLRLLMRAALDQSAENQRKMSFWARHQPRGAALVGQGAGLPRATA
jgi:hypothetical protein